MSERKVRKGDEVEWDHAQGTSKGEVVAVKTKDGKIKDFHYTASPEKPKYIVESDKTGARAAHDADELRKT